MYIIRALLLVCKWVYINHFVPPENITWLRSWPPRQICVLRMTTHELSSRSNKSQRPGQWLYVPVKLLFNILTNDISFAPCFFRKNSLWPSNEQNLSSPGPQLAAKASEVYSLLSVKAQFNLKLLSATTTKKPQTQMKSRQMLTDSCFLNFQHAICFFCFYYLLQKVFRNCCKLWNHELFPHELLHYIRVHVGFVLYSESFSADSLDVNTDAVCRPLLKTCSLIQW